MELRVGQAADKGRGNKVPEAELIPPERRRTGGLAPSGPPQRLRTGRPRNPGTQRPTRTNRWPTDFATSRDCGGVEEQRRYLFWVTDLGEYRVGVMPLDMHDLEAARG